MFDHDRAGDLLPGAIVWNLRVLPHAHTFVNIPSKA